MIEEFEMRRCVTGSAMVYVCCGTKVWKFETTSRSGLDLPEVNVLDQEDRFLTRVSNEG
jgi:hypothetical protein